MIDKRLDTEYEAGVFENKDSDRKASDDRTTNKVLETTFGDKEGDNLDIEKGREKDVKKEAAIRGILKKEQRKKVSLRCKFRIERDELSEAFSRRKQLSLMLMVTLMLLESLSLFWMWNVQTRSSAEISDVLEEVLREGSLNVTRNEEDFKMKNLTELMKAQADGVDR